MAAGAGRIRAEDVAAVRERASIDDVVGQYVQLKPAGGGSFKGLCPFHDERSASFHVTPARGVYYCFGCGEGGDVITFVEKVEHLSFAEAVEKLAVRAGVSLRYEEAGPGLRSGAGSQRQRLVAANAAAAEFYAEQLLSSQAGPARDFLSERGFDREAAERFGCGYSPPTWDALSTHLRGRGFTVTELETAGLSRPGRSGGLVDRFRGRLVWPIRDLAGEVVGFGARKLSEADTGPKYLNTQETPLFHKGKVLYGVDLAKRDIARTHQAVVVEGYTDVMACHLSGVPTAVATCGTSFGADHISVLRRLLMDQDEFRGEMIFTFDGDEAGRQAALRAFADDQKFVMQTFVAVEPGGMDPCELRQAKGDLAVRELVARRRPLVRFVLESTLSRHDLETAEGRVAALAACAPLVGRIRDRALRPEYARWLAGRLGMEPGTVSRTVAEAETQGQAGVPRQRQVAGGRVAERDDPSRSRDPRAPTGDPAARAVEREALKLLVQYPALATPYATDVGAVMFTDPRHKVLLAAIREAEAGTSTDVAAGGQRWVAAVAATCPDDDARALVLELAVEPPRTTPNEPDSRYAVAVLARVQEIALTRSIVELKSRMQRVNPVESVAEHSRLFAELVELEQRKRGLREQAIGAL